MAEPKALPASALRTYCDPACFTFDTTDALTSHAGDLGQARAVEAIQFGLAMGHSGYHVFVLGEPGSGKHATTFRLLRERAASEPVPPDLCYLHNFDEALKPRLLTLPAGRGARCAPTCRPSSANWGLRWAPPWTVMRIPSVSRPCRRRTRRARKAR